MNGRGISPAPMSREGRGKCRGSQRGGMDGTGSKQQRVCFGSSFSMLSHVWRQQRAGNVSDFTGLPRTANDQRAKEEQHSTRKRRREKLVEGIQRIFVDVVAILSSWVKVSGKRAETSLPGRGFHVCYRISSRNARSPRDAQFSHTKLRFLGTFKYK